MTEIQRRELSGWQKVLFMVLMPAGVVLFAVGGGRLEDSGGTSRPALLLVLGGLLSWCVVLGVNAWTRRRTTSAIAGIGVVFLAASFTLSHADLDLPGWVSSLALAVLVLLVAVGAPALMMASRRERDERERAILAGAASLAFLAVMSLVLAFSIMEHVASAPRLTSTWVLQTGLLTFVGVDLVLRRRM